MQSVFGANIRGDNLVLKTLVVEFAGSFDNSAFNRGTPAKNYTYLYTGAKDVRAGDHAIVHNGTHFGVTTVLRVLPGIGQKVTKNVIGVITKDEFLACEKSNGSINQHRKIFDQLDYMLEEQNKMDKYVELAKTNPAAAALMDQIRNFGNPALEATTATAAPVTVDAV